MKKILITSALLVVIVTLFALANPPDQFIHPNAVLAQSETTQVRDAQTQMTDPQNQVAVLQAEVAQLKHDKLALQGFAALLVYDKIHPAARGSVNERALYRALEHPEDIEVVTDGLHNAVRIRDYQWSGLNVWSDPVDRSTMDLTFRYSLPLFLVDWPDWMASSGPRVPLTLSH